MKFRDYIYIDEKRFGSYIDQISSLKESLVGKTESETSEINGEIKIPLVGMSSELSSTVAKTYLLNETPLEKLIGWCNINDSDIINMDNKSKLDENDTNKLCSLSGSGYLPEMIENVETIQNIKKRTSVMEYIPNISNEDKKIMDLLSEADYLPVNIDNGVANCTYNLRIKREYMKEDYCNFTDSIIDNIYVIGRIEKIYLEGAEIEIYDMCKEIFKFNRSVRRNMTPDDISKMLITEEAPLVKITPIVIYK